MRKGRRKELRYMLVKKINNLELDIQKTPYRYWLNIIKRFKDSDTGYVICGFEYDKDEHCYYIESCADRITDNDIEWFDLEVLIKYGFKILKGDDLKEMYHRLEEVRRLNN